MPEYTLYSLFEHIFARVRSAGDLATFPVPGEARLTLPVGKAPRQKVAIRDP